MSTPPEKPVGPVDLSAYLSQKARERNAAERDPAESGDAHLRSPYAPRSVSPYAPKIGGERTGSAPPSAISGPDKLWSVEHDRRDPASGGIAPGQPTDLDTLAARRSAPAGIHAERDGPIAGRGDQQVFTERDIERLESSLRWLQREEEAARLLRTAHEPAAHAEAYAMGESSNTSPRRLQSPRFAGAAAPAAPVRTEIGPRPLAAGDHAGEHVRGRRCVLFCDGGCDPAVDADAPTAGRLVRFQDERNARREPQREDQRSARAGIVRTASVLSHRRPR